MNPSRWTAECSRIGQLNVSLTSTALRALVPVLLCLCVGQPVQAQGFFKKMKAIAETVQRTGEKADTALSKAGQTADAVKCLASDSTCIEPVQAQGQPQVVGDSSGTQPPSPNGSDTLPPQAGIGFRARPDTSGS